MAKILFVEDEFILRENICDRLAEALPELQICCATNYHEAVAARRDQGPFDGILSDFRYAGIRDRAANPSGSGGLDLFIHNSVQSLVLPFVFLTNSTSQNLADSFLDRGLYLDLNLVFSKQDGDIEAAHYLVALISAATRPELAKPEVPSAQPRRSG